MWSSWPLTATPFPALEIGALADDAPDPGFPRLSVAAVEAGLEDQPAIPAALDLAARTGPLLRGCAGASGLHGPGRAEGRRLRGADHLARLSPRSPPRRFRLLLHGLLLDP